MVKYKSNLSEVLKHFNSGAEEAMSEIADIGKTAIISETPVDTGYLQSKNDSYSDKTSATFENTAPYAGFVQLGTYKMRANQFFTRGLLKSISKFKQVLLRRLKL